MNLLEYNLVVSVPSIVTFFVPFLAMFVLLACFRQKAPAVLSWLVPTIFSDLKMEKSDSGLRWFLRDIELTHNQGLRLEVLRSLVALYHMLFGVAAALFWHTLLVSVSHDDGCKPNPEFDCFVLHKKENQQFWNAYPRYLDDPFNCSSPEAQSGNLSFECYELVFDIGAASGASYGSFKLAMTLVNAITSAMMLHKRARSVTRTRIIIVLLFITLCTAFFAVVNTLAPNLVLLDISTSLGVLMFSFAVIILVFNIPWKTLVELKRDGVSNLDQPHPNNETLGV